MLPAAFNTRMEELGVGGDMCQSYGGNGPPKCGNLQLYSACVPVCQSAICFVGIFGLTKLAQSSSVTNTYHHWSAQL